MELSGCTALKPAVHPDETSWLLPQGVMPDIVTMAKGIGNGLPLAAVVTTPEIAQVCSIESSQR